MMKMLRMKSLIILDTQNAPACCFEHRVSIQITLDNFRMVMYSPVYFDHQPDFRNSKVRNDISDRMLPTDWKARLTKVTKRLPRRLLSACRRFSKAFRAISWVVMPSP